MTVATGDGTREVDSTGSIGLVDAEQDLLYDRPPLTKEALQEKAFGQHLVRQEERWGDGSLGRAVQEIAAGRADN